LNADILLEIVAHLGDADRVSIAHVRRLLYPLKTAYLSSNLTDASVM
jgi:hypothetical protein